MDENMTHELWEPLAADLKQLYIVFVPLKMVVSKIIFMIP